MKFRHIIPVLAILVGLTAGANAANSSDKVSKISVFAGPHNGSGIVLGELSGVTTGKFTASKKKRSADSRSRPSFPPAE
jgi:hypothetical protein